MASGNDNSSLASRVTIQSEESLASRVTISSTSEMELLHGVDINSIQSAETPSRFTATTISRFTVHTDPESVSNHNASLDFDIISMSSEEDLFVEAQRAGPVYDSFSSESESEQPSRNYNLELPTCTICLELISTDSILTPCQHTFHKACLIPACTEQEICPNCRYHFPVRWLHQNGIVVIMTAMEFWELFEFSFGPKPSVGPMIPTHQLRDELANGNIPRIPGWWTSQWIVARLAELRICHNIPQHIPLSTATLQQYEQAGIRGRIDIWADQFNDDYEPRVE